MNIPVVMCTWRRIERLPKTLDLLAAQTCDTFSFFIWNNNPEYAERIDALAASRDWPYPIAVHHSRENIGGFGRFVLCRSLAEDGRFTHAIFIDDDQEFSPRMVSGFIAEAEPETIRSRWSFTFRKGSHYWDRVRRRSGEPAHYCGTCGMVADLGVFREERFFTGCPERFRFVEDLWLSYYAQHVLGWRLLGSGVKVETIVDGKDSYMSLSRAKKEVLEHLRGMGWQV
jgi:hypothetical protein